MPTGNYWWHSWGEWEVARSSDSTWSQVGHDVVALGETLVPRRAKVSSIGREGAPDLFAEFEVRDGAPECTAIRWESKPGGRTIRSSDLRNISIEKLITKAFYLHARRSAGGGLVWATDGERSGWASIDDIKTAAETRPATTEDELRHVAALYRAHLQGHPTAMVAKLLGLSRRTAARRVQQARAAGFLPATTRGKKGA